MPKPMINITQTQNRAENILSAAPSKQQNNQTQQMDKMKLDRLLRQPRSKKYMDAMHKLDAGGHVHNQHILDEIIDAIREEFPEIDIKGVMLGTVSLCYLGMPYEVHTIDMDGGIIEHYKIGEKLPNGLEKARALAIRGGYEFIEVYIDCCRAISSTGAVSVIPC